MSLDLVAWFLIGLAVANVGSTVILVAAALRHPWPALEERATVAVILALIAAGAAVLSIQHLHLVELGDASIAILVGSLILVSLPSLIWTIAYWRGRFAGIEADSGEPTAYDGRGDH